MRGEYISVSFGISEGGRYADIMPLAGEVSKRQASLAVLADPMERQWRLGYVIVVGLVCLLLSVEKSS